MIPSIKSFKLDSPYAFTATIRLFEKVSITWNKVKLCSSNFFHKEIFEMWSFLFCFVLFCFVLICSQLSACNVLSKLRGHSFSAVNRSFVFENY